MAVSVEKTSQYYYGRVLERTEICEPRDSDFRAFTFEHFYC